MPLPLASGGVKAGTPLARAPRCGEHSSVGPRAAEPTRLALAGDDDAAAFIQRRVANAGWFACCMGAGFLVIRTGVETFDGDFRELREPSYLVHVAAMLPLLALWLSCRGRRRSPRFVVVAELAVWAVAGSLIILTGVYLPVFTRPDLIVPLVLSYLLLGRAIYVPSSAKRTMGLGAILAVPYLAMVYSKFTGVSEHMLAEALAAFGDADPVTLRAILTVWAVAWWTGVVVTSTAASHVFYGLREQVREVKRLGQYQLDEQLGEGGMGVVYRAHHALLQRPTAIKLLPPERVGEKSLERFEREVQQTARLTHPNTITIFDYGHTPEGVFYYAMELLDGVTLDTVIAATGRMPVARVIHILRQAAGSLAEAHRLGLVHRDVKPENIMLCEQGGIADTVKVLDFGLVKEVSRGGDVKLTASNVLMGTPQYMAPEAIAGAGEVDARADLYALAATAYLLITGREVFEADTVIEICSHHLQTAPTPPSALVDGVPGDLEAIVLRCLEKDPAERPADAAELSALLEGCSAAGMWRQADARSWWASHGHALARPGGVSTTAPTMLALSDGHERDG